MQKQYHIHYFKTPIHFKPFPKKADKGNSLISKGLRALKQKYLGKWQNVNVIKNGKKVINGLGNLYGYEPRVFIKNNLIIRDRHAYLSQNGMHLTLRRWLMLIICLRNQLHKVWLASNLAQIQQMYPHLIQVNGLSNNELLATKQAPNHRKYLAKLANQRCRFIGTYIRHGSTPQGKITLLLVNIKYRQHIITSHVWFNNNQHWRALGHLIPGNQIVFTARVKPYTKGYIANSFRKYKDYHLVYPTKIKVNY